MRTGSQTSDSSRNGSARLDSWKEIASFFGRDVRTVRRWRAERNLPVHRIHDGERSPVFAYVSELQEWMDESSAVVEEEPVNLLIGSTAEIEQPDAGSAPASISPAEPDLPVAVVTAAEETRRGSAETRPVQKSSRRTFAIAAIVLLLAGAATFLVRRQNAATAAPVTSSVSLRAPSPEAQELYLRARFFWEQRNEESLNRAVDLFTQAIVHDPKYAAAYAGLADSYLLLRQYGKMPDREAYPRALAAARQAVALDELSPEAHRSLGFILTYWVWDWPAADREFRRSIQLGPNESQTHHWYATALFTQGLLSQSMEEINAARRLEPQSLSVLADRGLIMSSGDRPAAIAELERVEQMDASFVSPHLYLASLALRVRDYRRFLDESLRVAELGKDEATMRIFRTARQKADRKGERASARALLEELQPLTESGAVPASLPAEVAVYLDDPVAAVHFVKELCVRRSPVCLTLEHDAEYDGLRSVPEFQAILASRFLSHP